LGTRGVGGGLGLDGARPELGVLVWNVLRVAVDVAEHGPGEAGRPGEALCAVARLVDDEQPGPGRVVTDEGGQRRAGLARQLGGDDHQRTVRQVDVPDALRGLRAAGLGGEEPGEGGQR